MTVRARIHKRSLGKGMNDDTLERMKEIKAELLMIWGRQNPHVPQEGRALIYDAMTKAGVRFSWVEFNTAHAFLRDEGPRYDPELALRCYGIPYEKNTDARLFRTGSQLEVSSL